jgi:hypothetical protein
VLEVLQRQACDCTLNSHLRRRNTQYRRVCPSRFGPGVSGWLLLRQGTARRCHERQGAPVTRRRHGATHAYPHVRARAHGPPADGCASAEAVLCATAQSKDCLPLHLSNAGNIHANATSAAHNALARTLAEQSAVLLQVHLYANQAHILHSVCLPPLSPLSSSLPLMCRTPAQHSRSTRLASAASSFSETMIRSPAAAPATSTHLTSSHPTLASPPTSLSTRRGSDSPTTMARMQPSQRHSLPRPMRLLSSLRPPQVKAPTA